MREKQDLKLSQEKAGAQNKLHTALYNWAKVKKSFISECVEDLPWSCWSLGYAGSCLNHAPCRMPAGRSPSLLVIPLAGSKGCAMVAMLTSGVMLVLIIPLFITRNEVNCR